MAKTALELSREEWKRYNPSIGLERSLRGVSADIEDRKNEAWRVARKAANLLRKDFGSERVFVFGSLANDIGFNYWSDIDLATVGIAPELFYSAVAAVNGLSPRFKVDLVDVNDCRLGLKKVIEEEGFEI